jgi:hypothetical protein
MAWIRIAACFSLALLYAATTHWMTATAFAQPPEFSNEDIEFFEKRIRPVLVKRCWECHGADPAKLRGGLRLDSRQAILRGGETGPAAVVGDVMASLISEAIGFESSQIEMPPSGKMPAQEIADLREWIRRGLPFPSAETTAAARPSVDLEAGRRHWAFQSLPIRSQKKNIGAAAAITPVDGSEPALSRVDLHLRSTQHRLGLQSSPPADHTRLLRRLKLDLIGLPPTVEEIDEFSHDTSPDAYARWVDRFLASPRHGERYGRFWLDLARYCDVPEQWREGEAKAYLYRDWVVGAVNADLPYSDFIRRQLAADQQPGARPEDNAALGFLGLSPTYWKELKLDPTVIKQVVADEWEERIEAIGATFLGLTLACARCHDHKYDPVSMSDYYALAGVLANTRQQDVPVIANDLAATAAAARRKVKELEGQIAKLRANKTPSDEDRRKTAEFELEAAKLRTTPFFDLPPAFGVTDARLHVLPDGPNRTKLEYRPEFQDIELHIRGNPAKPGAAVSRRFLTVLSPSSPRIFQQGSGRRDLAEAIVQEAGPLVARVAVNRAWMQHFERPLVATPSNFGLQTSPPPHAALLDELAADFVASEWSLKSLHRELVLTATYRQTSNTDAARLAIDPDNSTLWRMPVRRLDVEAWRDSLLAASDSLDLRMGGPPAELNELNNRRRTLYGLVRRRELSDLLRLYDFPDPVSHAALRDPTTTPLQQLFVLNSPLIAQWSEWAGKRWAAMHPGKPDDSIRAAYRELFLRDPTSTQLARGRAFLADAQASGQPAEAAWRQYAQALLASNEMLFVD